MSAYTRFFLQSKRSVAQIECIEISHPNFSQVFRIVRNYVGGATVKHEDNISYAYSFYPLRITRDGMTDDLDSSLKIDLGDLGDLVQAQWEQVVADNGTHTKPTVKFRVYRSDDLNTLLYGPYVYEAVDFSITREGTSFTAQAPKLNLTATGEIYTLDRFPGLRGTL